MTEIVEGEIGKEGGIRSGPLTSALFLVGFPSPGYGPDKGMGD